MAAHQPHLLATAAFSLLLAAAATAVPQQHAAAAPVIVLVADNTTEVPVAGGPFSFFSAPTCSGGSAFFVGSPDSGKGGIFNAVLAGAAPPTTLGITVKTGPPSWADAMPGAPSGTTIYEVSDGQGVRAQDLTKQLLSLSSPHPLLRLTPRIGSPALSLVRN
jgi:hypothetical protein